MNERIRELAEQAGLEFDNDLALEPEPIYYTTQKDLEKFAELIVKECADICMEMATKCAGLPGDGALAKDCADWIKKDFGVEEWTHLFGVSL